MGTSLKRLTGSGLAMAMCLVTLGAEQLHLDGILIVKGLPLDGSRVIVVAKDGEDQVITENLAHFTLKLDLQKDYLVSFERPGCVSKQLRFNTNVPAGEMNPEGFRFPFQVTLEPAPEGQHMEYAGPVGYILFNENLHDFSYSTNYRILKEEFLAEELELVQSKLNMKEQPVPSIIASSREGDASVGSNRSPSGAESVKPVHAQEVIAPTISRTPPLVHVLATPPKASPLPVSSPEALPSAPNEHVAQVLPASPVAAAEVPVSISEPMRTNASFGMEKEVQADSLHVTTIIRFHKGSSTDEYRRVVSYYGGTTYFCKGYACSADTYQKEINR